MSLLRTFLIVLIVFMVSVACTVTNKYGPYYGKVVDAETKTPIEGAAVLVVYRTERYGLAGPVSLFEDSQETVTDKNGEFIVSTKRVNTFRIISGWERYPQIIIFKPGYGCYPFYKNVSPRFEYGSLPANEHVTIELPILKTTQERLTNTMIPLGPDIPIKKYKKLDELIREELRLLGR